MRLTPTVIAASAILNAQKCQPRQYASTKSTVIQPSARAGSPQARITSSKQVSIRTSNFRALCRSDFVTLSTWTEWDVVEDATGGDIRRPAATRHAERLVAWSASHFEVVGPEPAG